MQTRKLGSRGLEVSALGFGCLGLGRAYHSALRDDEAIDLVLEAFENGITYFDTAPVFGPYSNEILVGKALAPIRDKVTIATKFGAHAETGRVNCHPDRIRLEVEASLRRLGTDYIDLLYQFGVDPTVPVEEVAGAVKDLIRQGKVLHFGMCDAGAFAIGKANREQPVSVVQAEYSLWNQGADEAVLSVCEQNGIGFVPYSPLGLGFLAGGINATTIFAPSDLRRCEPRFRTENLKANLQLLDILRDYAARYDATPAQIALAWLLQRKDWIVPIPSTSDPRHLHENLHALKLNLDPQDVIALGKAADSIDLPGARLPAESRHWMSQFMPSGIRQAV